MAFDYNNYYELEWIQNSNCYFNTGIPVQKGTTVADLRIVDSTSHGNVGTRVNVIGNYGASGSAGLSGLSISSTNKYIGFIFGTNYRYTTETVDTTHRYLIRTVLMDGLQTQEIDGVELLNHTNTNTFTTTNTIYIGGGRYDNSNYATIDCEIYSVKLFDVDGDELGVFIPAQRKSDGVAGLYDTVNEVFITKSGSGNVIPGPVKTNYNARIKISNEWKDGVIYFKDNGVWKSGTPYIKVNGTWKKGG